MIVDTSAVIAIAFGEPEADRLVACLDTASSRWMSSVTALECQMVMTRIGRSVAGDALRRLLTTLRIDVVPFTPDHSAIAVDAFLAYGKGQHPAALNLGDCCSYALAKLAGEALLFKGDDFSRTDIEPAIW